MRPLKTARPSADVVEQVDESPPRLAHEAVRTILSRHYSGPIPPAEQFKVYGEVLADAPERILRVFEQDSEHVRQLQRSAFEAERAEGRRLQWMGFGLIGGGMIVSVLLALTNREALAGGLLTTTLVGTIGTLLKSRKPHP